MSPVVCVGSSVVQDDLEARVRQDALVTPNMTTSVSPLKSVASSGRNYPSSSCFSLELIERQTDIDKMHGDLTRCKMHSAFEIQADADSNLESIQAQLMQVDQVR